MIEAPGRLLDLGSGGGVPGLVLSTLWPQAEAVLLDRRQRAGAFLAQAVIDLELGHRVQVVVAEAEQAARDGALRGSFDLVVARSFGPPAATAECAVGFLGAGGLLAVSEPPASGGQRWPEAPLAALGLSPPEIRHAGETTVAVLRATGEPGDRWPRRSGRPAKRPLWGA